jgi:RNA polymerase sigma-70 factor (ECF subfamily)
MIVTPAEPGDESLAAQAAAGDDHAFEQLVSRYEARVYRLACRLTSETDAPDVLQETFLQVYRNLRSFRGDSRFSTWLHRIAVNSALHGRRSRLRKAGRETAMDDSYSVRAVAETSVLKLKLELAMEKLPEGMRKVLVLHDVEGYTHEEIGAMLGVNPGTCKSQLFKARARMRKLLTPQPLPDDEPAEEELACSI